QRLGGSRPVGPDRAYVGRDRERGGDGPGQRRVAGPLRRESGRGLAGETDGQRVGADRRQLAGGGGLDRLGRRGGRAGVRGDRPGGGGRPGGRRRRGGGAPGRRGLAPRGGWPPPQTERPPPPTTRPRDRARRGCGRTG